MHASSAIKNVKNTENAIFAAMWWKKSLIKATEKKPTTHLHDITSLKLTSIHAYIKVYKEFLWGGVASFIIMWDKETSNHNHSLFNIHLKNVVFPWLHSSQGYVCLASMEYFVPGQDQSGQFWESGGNWSTL